MRNFNIKDYKSLRKTKKALETVKEEDRKEILRYYCPKTSKRMDKITWRDLADRVFSEYCRLYYCDKEWYVNCITSWIKMPWEKAQCWHFISRGTMKYRYDILNCYPQSYQDNVMLSWNYKIYTLKMIDMLWRERVEEMLNDKEIVSYSQNWYEENIQKWYKIIQKKKKEIAKMSLNSLQDLSEMEF